MKYGIIYKITNQINGKIYIGKTTKTIEERFKKHYYSRRISDYCLPRALRKYGLNSFIIEEICTASNINDLNFLEEEMIKIYNSRVPNGYNIGAGGEGQSMTSDQYQKIAKQRMTWYQHSSETIKKIRQGNIGKKRSSESLQQMVETRRLRGNLGRKGRPIILVKDDIEIGFKNIKTAEQFLGITSKKYRPIQHVLNGYAKTYKGYSVRYMGEV